MRENKVIAAIILERQAFDAVAPYHETSDFSDLGEIIFKEVEKYYQRDTGAAFVDTDSLLSRLRRGYAKHYDKFEKFMDEMPEVSIDNLLDDYREMKMDSLGELAGSLLMSGEHKKAQEILDKYNRLRAEGLASSTNQEESMVYQGATVAEFSESFAQENRIQLAPKELNTALNGGLIPGCHVLIYAPPETGKTACAITQAFAIAYRGKKVLYAGNEEPAAAYLMRMKCRFTGMEEDEVQANPEKADALAEQRGWGNLVFAHMSPGTTDEVKALAKEHEVDVVILDQLHNLKHSQYPKLEGTQLLTQLAYTMRMFYSKTGIAGISFTQADEKAIGKVQLSIKDVYYSNIGVQGQTDVMIGIGMNDDLQRIQRRCYNFTKNKIGGIHEHYMVGIKPRTSSIISLEK